MRDTLHEIRKMKNKPKFSRPKMNVSSVVTREYEYKPLSRHGKTNPNPESPGNLSLREPACPKYPCEPVRKM
jgi:hypothetical protein